MNDFEIRLACLRLARDSLDMLQPIDEVFALADRYEQDVRKAKKASVYEPLRAASWERLQGVRREGPRRPNGVAFDPDEIA